MLFRTEPVSPSAKTASTDVPPRVAVIGGGFAGASIARCLALSGEIAPGGIVVFEPRTRLGAGLAYDVDDPALRLNVPAHRMRALPGQPDAFADFLRTSGRLADDGAAMAGADIYARRADFAAFMQAAMEPFLANGTIEHRHVRVSGLQREDRAWRIETANGDSLRVDAVVIAIGHPSAEPPAALACFAATDPRLLRNPDGMPPVGRQDRVLIVGAGLTALDYMAALDERNHTGPITLLSRTGLLPQAQAKVDAEPCGEFLTPPTHRAAALLHAVRQAIRAAQENGASWHGVFDTLRKQGQSIWQALPGVEQARFLRHARRRYETHRFRMPPQSETLIERLRKTGRLTSLTGRIRVVRDDGNVFDAELDLKGQAAPQVRAFDRIAIATGPDQRQHFSTQPWLGALAAAGYAVPAPHGLGIACDTHCRVLNGGGQPNPDLFVIGPPTRATFGEITGAPEIAAQAVAVAANVLATLRASRTCATP